MRVRHWIYKFDNQFNSVFNEDLALINGINEQKQRLFIFLKTPKGSIKNAPNWGFDYDLAFRFAQGKFFNTN
ncbi:hypothetical protein [Borrelia puertoricensis]|uniref:hypothetical protein n=1 Tax=Borrelia puertoricensis TaxID=2756107 RepID=UPI001FF4B76C|nr:hypothetical protein [Borrelia puertoricensis]